MEKTENYKSYIIREGLNPFELFVFQHKAHNGPSDPRAGFGDSIEDCKTKIDDQIEELKEKDI